MKGKLAASQLQSDEWRKEKGTSGSNAASMRLFRAVRLLQSIAMLDCFENNNKKRTRKKVRDARCIGTRREADTNATINKAVK